MIPVNWLSKYVYCPMKLYLEVVAGIKPKLELRMLLGTIGHSILLKAFAQDEKIISRYSPEMDQNSLFSSFWKRYLDIAFVELTKQKPELSAFNIELLDVFDSMKPILQRLARLRSKEVAVFASSVNVHGKQLTKLIYPKYQVNLKLESDRLQLKGEIDLVESYKDFKQIVDLKLSEPPNYGLWPTDQIQLGAYTLLLREITKQPVKAAVFYVKYGNRKSISINPLLEKEVYNVRDRILEMTTKRNKPEFKINKQKCDSCSLAEHCPLRQ